MCAACHNSIQRVLDPFRRIFYCILPRISPPWGHHEPFNAIFRICDCSCAAVINLQDSAPDMPMNRQTIAYPHEKQPGSEPLRCGPLWAPHNGFSNSCLVPPTGRHRDAQVRGYGARARGVFQGWGSSRADPGQRPEVPAGGNKESVWSYARLRMALRRGWDRRKVLYRHNFHTLFQVGF